MSNYKLSKEDKLLKEKIYKYLSYTSQDYEAILGDMIELIKSNEINMEWDNLSEADPIFILMHLLAAHKDILNYMLDYRVLESYMLTARERASLIRIANSVGYKIPGLVPSHAMYRVTNISSETSTLKAGQSFTLNENSWVYMEPEELLLKVNPATKVPLVQGIPEKVTFTIDNINENNNSFTLAGTDIATYRNTKYHTSLLSTTDNKKWKEVDSLVGRSINDNPKPYIIDKDTTGLYYIKFPTDFRLINDYIGVEFSLIYLSTNGDITANAPSKLTTSIGGTTATVEYVNNTFLRGKAELTADEVKEGYKNYRGTLTSLLTLEDYKQFILTKQTTIPDVAKVLVADVQSSTNPSNSDLESEEIALGHIIMYILKYNENNTFISPTIEEIQALKEELARVKQAGIILHFNKYTPPATDQDPTPGDEKVIKIVDINITFSSSGSVSIDEEIKNLITEYINNKDFGVNLKISEIKYIILTSKYNQYYIGKDLNVTMTPNNPQLAVYEAARVETIQTI